MQQQQMKKGNTGGSYLPGDEAAEAAQREARRAIANEWATMYAPTNYADADEVPDPLEVDDYVITSAQNLEAPEESLRQPEVALDASLPEHKKSFKLMLSPSEARHYVDSASPTVRGVLAFRTLRFPGRMLFIG